MAASNSVHVPRVWEVTGRAPEDRRRAVREWNDTYRGKIPFEPSFTKPRPRKPRNYRPLEKPELNTIVLHEQRRPKRWHDYRPAP